MPGRLRYTPAQYLAYVERQITCDPLHGPKMMIDALQAKFTKVMQEILQRLVQRNDNRKTYYDDLVSRTKRGRRYLQNAFIRTNQIVPKNLLFRSNDVKRQTSSEALFHCQRNSQKTFIGFIMEEYSKKGEMVVNRPDARQTTEDRVRNRTGCTLKVIM